MSRIILLPPQHVLNLTAQLLEHEMFCQGVNRLTYTQRAKKDLENWIAGLLAANIAA